ncbi:Hypothetical protein BRZCDTV_406 [Brazilian cedratvirus IHUMI]|uniref:Hedgehog/Intein (Hint) domain-containing protein n=1 Tax=Brazilian cedratvirus IHUMI TaxID=2126980 RepID=A0A2R8FEU2_9VIRU|nr:Hypothetical protein BRZCDTV_406 [Brazilian cedratvirus IHUMI]
MTSFNETFNTNQTQGTTIPYAGTWNPTSTRQLLVFNGILSNISSSLLNLLNLPSVTGLDVSVIYTFPAPTDLSQIGFFIFEGITFASPPVDPLTITVSNDGTPVGSSTINANGNLTVPVSTLSSTSTTLGFNFFFPNTIPSGFTVTVDNITSLLVCVAWGSEIECLEGNKLVQDVERGDELKTTQGFSKVARVIRVNLNPACLVEAVVIKRHALEPGLPSQDTILCADHYLIYKNKRRLARSLIAFPGVKFVRARVEDVLPADEHGNYYFYDIQYDHEADYKVNGLISQSRSPYASSSPLPLELYFNKDNYREERTKNTLTSEPEITYKYLLPLGEEVESLLLLKPNI